MRLNWLLWKLLVLVAVFGAPGCLVRDKPEAETPAEATCSKVAKRVAIECVVLCTEFQHDACRDMCMNKHHAAYYACLHPETVDASVPTYATDEEPATPATKTPTVVRPTVFHGQGFAEHFAPQ